MSHKSACGVVGQKDGNLRAMFMTDWGNIPDWVAAVGTSGALLVVAYQSLLTRKEIRSIMADRERERSAERGRSSQLVSVSASVSQEADKIRVTYTIRNDGAVVVTNISVVLVEPHATFPPSLDEAAFTQQVPDLPTYQSYAVHAVVDAESIDLGQFTQHEDELGAVYFTDANEHNWLRWGTRRPTHA